MAREYVPAAGSYPALAVAHLSATPGLELDTASLAAAIGMRPNCADGNFGRAVKHGLLRVRRDGLKKLWSVPVVGEAQPLQELARMAVTALNTGMLSSSVLAGMCRCEPVEIDRALNPLVAASKLMRVAVVRRGKAEFDYRYGAAYVPHDEDFEFEDDGTPAPIAQVADAAPPPAPRPPGPTPRVDIPVPQRLTTAGMAREHGAELLREPAHLVGWSAAPPAPPPTAQTPREQRDADDLVCAINSRGELVLDLGEEGLVQFAPRQALILKQFLDNTSVLEELAGKEAI